MNGFRLVVIFSLPPANVQGQVISEVTIIKHVFSKEAEQRHRLVPNSCPLPEIIFGYQ